MPETEIQIHGLEMKYHHHNATIAVRVREARLRSGRITTLIGRNGSGKSTLLKGIAGLLPYHGSIRIGEKECREYAHQERARIVAYLPQMLTSARMDVETLVEHGRYPHHGNWRGMTAHDRELVDYAMELADVSGLRDKSLQELSGGERQRAYLAMVIAQDTPMILLDEPTTYMDVSHQCAILEILRRLASDGRGIVMASHDLPQSFSCSDEICVLDRGVPKIFDTAQAVLLRDDLLREAMGVGLHRVDAEDALYPYVLRR